MRELREILERGAARGGPGAAPTTGRTNTSSVAPEAPAAVEACPSCEGARFVRVTVDPASPEFGRAVPCECARREDERERRERLLRYSRLGALSRFSFESLVEQGRSGRPEAQARYGAAVAAARRFAERPEGWLVLTGVPGCGKTHVAASIANRAIELGTPALVLSVADLLDQLRASYADDAEVPYERLLERIRNAPLVVLDDLDTFAATPWAREKFFQLVSHRFHAALPTVFTCVRVDETVDERLAARLLDPSLSQVLELETSDAPRYSQIGGMTRDRLEDLSFESFRPMGRGLRGAERRNLEGAFREANKWANDPTGWLVLRGEAGCGKTHLAAAIAGQRLQTGDSVCFANVADLLDELRASYAPEASERFDTLFRRLREVRVLILDDFGAQQSTPWVQEKLYQILNHRHLQRLPTVITTNMELKDLEPRVASRLSDLDMSLVYEITAPDYRIGLVDRS